MENGTPAEREQLKNFIPERCNDDQNSWPSLPWYKFDSITSGVIAIVLLCLMQYFYWVKAQFRELQRSEVTYYRLTIVFTVISIADSIASMIQPSYHATAAALIRPLYLIISINVLRVYTHRYLLVIKDSAPIVTFICIYILYFSVMA